MKTRVLILGGYGNFGGRIAELLLRSSGIQIIIAGRSAQKCTDFVKAHAIAASPPEMVTMDIATDLTRVLKEISPHIVIHTSGPFQMQGYGVAQACIAAGVHYIDLADGREFVAGIQSLDAQAKAAGVCVISGASSVPCLTAAVIDDCKGRISEIHSLDYGITTAHKTPPGTATTAAILGYLGKPFQTILNGQPTTIYGWQGLTSRVYPELGRRLLGYCDVPDLELFPQRYPTLKNIRFRAGVNVPFLHLTLWALSWLSRGGLVKTFAPLAALMNKASGLFNIFGTNRSGFHMEIQGVGVDGAPKTETFYLLTDQGHGPYIPCIPSVLCAQMIADGRHTRAGAYPCLDIITLPSYLDALKPYAVKSLRK